MNRVIIKQDSVFEPSSIKTDWTWGICTQKYPAVSEVREFRGRGYLVAVYLSRLRNAGGYFTEQNGTRFMLGCILILFILSKQAWK